MNFINYYNLFNKYKKGISLIWILSLIAFGTAYTILPKKYKSVCLISISTKYFQSPLVRDFVTEIYDSQEMRSQKESLLIGSLSDFFVDNLQSKYNLHKQVSKPDLQTKDYIRSLIRKQIEFTTLTSSVNQISFFTNNPQVAHEALQDIVQQIKKHFFEQRQKFLSNLRKSIKQNLDQIIFDLNNPSSKIDETQAVTFSNSSSERNKIQSQIDQLLKFYNKEHPKIRSLYKKLNSLSDHINEKVASVNIEVSDERKDKPQFSNNEKLLKGRISLYEDLLQKYEYLNIAINSEHIDNSDYISILQNPTYPLNLTSPNKILFLMWFCIFGFIFSSIYIVFSELFYQEVHLKKMKPSLQLQEELIEDPLPPKTEHIGLNDQSFIN